MSIVDYVSEEGSGRYAQWRVPDIVPPREQPVSLVLALESPHVDELASGTPLSGDAGSSALSFLRDLPRTVETLGKFVRARHDAGDFRVAIMNVSNVPLQKKAFENRPAPAFTPAEWEALRIVRDSEATSLTGTRCAESNVARSALLVGLQARLDAVALGAACVVVPCGVFARKFIVELQRLPATVPHRVPHPSRNQWTNHPTDAALLELRTLFARNT